MNVKVGNESGSPSVYLIVQVSPIRGTLEPRTFVPPGRDNT